MHAALLGFSQPSKYGVQVGMLAVGMALCTEALHSWKNVITRRVIHDGHANGIVRGCLLHMSYSIGLVLVGISLVRQLSITRAVTTLKSQVQLHFEVWPVSLAVSIAIHKAG